MLDWPVLLLMEVGEWRIDRHRITLSPQDRRQIYLHRCPRRALLRLILVSKEMIKYRRTIFSFPFFKDKEIREQSLDHVILDFVALAL